MSYKKDRYIVEDMIIPCCIEYALGNLLIGTLVDGGAQWNYTKPTSDLIISKTEEFLKENTHLEDAAAILEGYKIVCRSILKAYNEIDYSRHETLKRRISTILGKINQFFVINHFNTRKVLLLVVEWARLLRDNNFIEVLPECMPVLEDLIDTYTKHLPEHLGGEEYYAFHRSTIKQAVKLHALVLQNGYFLGCPPLEVVSGEKNDGPQ